jgi:serine/threonine protein kinase
MLEPQTVLQNRYLITKQIGQGGMGAVYIATDQRFGSTVAVKETFFADPNLRKAFEREARLLNSLRHSALPRVSDHFIEGDGQFLVMEFIGGDDLGEMLEKKGGAFPVEQVLHWADQLLDALNYLHSHQPPIVHRDIKPQNLKLMPNGQIILLDFGLAKGNASHATRATNTGSIFGYSRHYAPLEQIQGAGTDPRSDIYSIAATLYHLLTGIIPPDSLSRATAVINGQPDPLIPANEVHAQVNSALAQVLYQAMSQKAAQRPASAANLRAMLREAASAGLTNEKITTPLVTGANTILDQDTKIMHTSPVGEPLNVAEVVHAPQTVPMTQNFQNTEPQPLPSSPALNLQSQPSSSALNPTIAPNPQMVSNPNPMRVATIAETDSVVTKIASVHHAKRSGAARYIGIAACILLLLGVSGLAYRYTFKQNDTGDTVPVQQVTIPNSQPSANVVVEPATNENQNENQQVQQTTTVKPQAQTEQRKQQTTSANKTSSGEENSETSTQQQTSSTPTQTTTSDGHGEASANTSNTKTPVQQQPTYPNAQTELQRRQREAEMKRRFKRRVVEEMRRRPPPNFRPR